jgi:protein phosphatase
MESGMSVENMVVEQPGLELEVAGLTDVGRHREQNEDYWAVPGDAHAGKLATHGYLVAVADGMGGHALGELASRLAVDTLLDIYYDAPPDPLLSLAKAIDVANAAVFTQAQMRNVSMGTTLVGAVFHQQAMTLFNIGDSRVYRVRGETIRQLTRDHSLVAEQVRRGMLTAEEARLSPVRNVLLRSIGHRPISEPDLTETGIAAGDSYLVCSDGLHSLVAPEEISAIVAGDEPAAAVRRLVDLANERGGIDNITCLIVRVIACAAAGETIDNGETTGDADQPEPGAGDGALAGLSRENQARLLILRQRRAFNLLSAPFAIPTR